MGNEVNVGRLFQLPPALMYLLKFQESADYKTEAGWRERSRRREAEAARGWRNGG